MANTGSNKTTAWFIVGFIVVVTAAVIIAGALSSGDSNNSSNSDFVPTATSPITPTDWTIGNPAAKVSLIEYGDFECPACGEYEPLVEQLIDNYSSTVLFVFRNFPLTSIHPFAMIGAEAAEAAGMMGGTSTYWKMHNLLYANQTTWTGNTALTPAQVVSQYFNGYAQSLGLNVATFDADMNSTQVNNKIQNDITTGNNAQIGHTPTFFVNLEQIPNPTSYSDFQTVLNAAIASSTGQAPANTTAPSGIVPSTITVTSTSE